MTTLSSVVKANQIPVTAGASILQNELVQIFSDGKAYPCQVSDYAAVANAGAAILATTTSSQYVYYPFSGAGTNLSGSNQIISDSAGNLYCALETTGPSSSANSSLQINKYSLSGVLLGTVALTSSDYPIDLNIGQLSNGNIFVTWTQNSSLLAYYAIITPSLDIVVPQTTMNGSSSSSSPYVSSLPLPSGGFAAVYTNSSGVEQVSVYNNAGVFQTSATITGSSNYKSAIALLSSGNIAVVTKNGTTLSFTIFSPALAIVTATTSTTVAPNGYGPSINVMSGFVAFGTVGGGTVAPNEIAIVSNAGVQQGATVSVAGTSNGPTSCQLFNDGTQFWLVTAQASGGVGTYGMYVSISTAGVATIYNTSVTFGSYFTSAWDSVTNRIYTLGTGASIFEFSPSNPGTVNTVSISANLLSSDGVQYLLSLGDGALFVGGANSSATNNPFTYSIWKAENTAVLGPAQSAASAGATVEVVTASGYYPITQLRGSPTKSFNMNSTSGSNLIGNKGVIAGIGVGQVGIA